MNQQQITFLKISAIGIATFIAGFISATIIIAREYKNYVPNNSIPFSRIELNDVGFFDTYLYNTGNGNTVEYTLESKDANYYGAGDITFRFERK